MSCACHCCDAPPDGAVAFIGAVDWAAYNDGTDFAPDPAALIPDFAGYGVNSYHPHDDVDPNYFFGQYPAAFYAYNWHVANEFVGDGFWNKGKLTFAIRFKPVASCSFRIWWDENEYDIGGSLGGEPVPTGSPVASTAQEWEWTPPSVDGLCIPSGYDPGDLTTWPHTEDFTINVPASASRMIIIENIRWSFAPGYTPPSDGSANGWPP